MSAEWPIKAAEPQQEALPLAMADHVAIILASPSVRAFAEKRAQQLLEHGHRPEDDALLTIDRLVEFAAEACVAVLERTGRFRLMDAPPEIRDLLLRRIDSAGALLLAARDRILMPPNEEGMFAP